MHEAHAGQGVRSVCQASGGCFSGSFIRVRAVVALVTHNGTSPWSPCILEVMVRELKFEWRVTNCKFNKKCYMMELNFMRISFVSLNVFIVFYKLKFLRICD